MAVRSPLDNEKAIDFFDVRFGMRLSSDFIVGF